MRRARWSTESSSDRSKIAPVSTRPPHCRRSRQRSHTLSDRLAGGAPSNFGSELPEDIKGFLAEEGRGEVFGVTEFQDRLGARMATDPETATQHAQAVLDVVRDAVDEQVVDRVADQLPDDYSALFEGQEISPSA